MASIELAHPTGEGAPPDSAALLAEARAAVARTGELLAAHLDALKALHVALSAQAVEHAESDAAASGLPFLTPRQLEVLGYLADGLSTRQIAERLWLSGATVRNHVSAILAALDSHSRLEAVARGRRLGLV
jgi:DNA-binding NarL/FixJ family response regulator